MALVALVALAAAASGCSPKIGSKCNLSTDCSVTGGRVCDTSQTGGYCTVLNCVNNSCPDHAVCVLFQASVPGCPYNDYQSPSRTGRSFCMEHCNDNSDCRQTDGYSCEDPRDKPWLGYILDNNQEQRVCMIPASFAQNDNFEAGSPPVCTPGLLADASAEADAEADAGPDAADAGEGGEAEAPDASVEDGGVSDATLDAPADAEDATGGG
jgi:hypothetical protein